MIRAIVLLVAGTLSLPALADGTGHVNFLLAQKVLEDAWDPVERQGAFGALMSFGREGWPVHIVADVLASGREGTLGGDATVFGATLEAATGIRKIWGNKQIHPYVGAGLTLLSAAVEVESPLGTTDDQDVALGPWAGGGIFWRLGTRFNIGIDLRWSAADVELDFDDGAALRDLDAGGMHYGLTLGFGW